jgi:hypothetical protein
VDLGTCRSRGLSVTNAGPAFAVDSADYAVGLVVAVLRRVAAADAYVRRGRWAADGDYPLATKVSTSWPLLPSAVPFSVEGQYIAAARISSSTSLPLYKLERMVDHFLIHLASRFCKLNLKQHERCYLVVKSMF